MGKLKRIAALCLAMMMLLSGCSQYIEDGFYADETTESADNQADMSAEGTSGTESETESETQTETDNGDFLDLESGDGRSETESEELEPEQPSGIPSSEEAETESEEYLDLWSEKGNETETEEEDDDRDITFSKSENFMLTLYEGGSVTIQVNDDEPYTVWCEDDKRYYEDSKGIVELTDPLTYGMYFDTGCSIGDRVSMSIKPNDGFLVGSCFDYYSLKNFDNFEVNSEGFDYTVNLEKKTWAYITYNKWRDVIRSSFSTYGDASNGVANCKVSPTSTSADANGTSVFNMLFNDVDLRIGVCASPNRKTTDTGGNAVTTTAWQGDDTYESYNIALAAILTCPIDLTKYRGGAQKGSDICTDGSNGMNGGNNGIGVYWMTGDAEGVWDSCVSCRAGNGNYFGELHGFLGYLNHNYWDSSDGDGWEKFINAGECTALIESLKTWISTHTDLMEASAFNACASYKDANGVFHQRICCAFTNPKPKLKIIKEVDSKYEHIVKYQKNDRGPWLWNPLYKNLSAEFTVYEYKDGGNHQGTEVAKITTNSEGVSDEVKLSKAGKYLVKETKAPTNYVLDTDNDSVVVEVSAGETKEVMLYHFS